MPTSSPQDQSSIRVPHPLARLLIEHYHDRSGIRVLDFASGSGRNATALQHAGFHVTCISDAAARTPRPLDGIADEFEAALSTHGLLHGTAGEIASYVGAIANVLGEGGRLYATFGSVRDKRFGEGRRIAETTFAPDEGDERGVAHTYFSEAALRVLLERHFVIESLMERSADETAGSWAHRERPLSGAVHWFTTARKDLNLLSI